MKLNLNRIWLGTLVDNKGMNQLAKNLNMKLEGTFREAMLFEDHYTDIQQYSILQNEWRSTQ